MSDWEFAPVTSVASVTTTAGSATATVTSGGFPSVTNGLAIYAASNLLYPGTTVDGAPSSNNLTLSIPAANSGTQTFYFGNDQLGVTIAPPSPWGLHLGESSHIGFGS